MSTSFFPETALKSAIRSLQQADLEKAFGSLKERFPQTIELSTKMISYKW